MNFKAPSKSYGARKHYRHTKLTFKGLARAINRDGLAWFAFTIACMLFILGTCMNFAAVSNNKGMPVYTEDGFDFVTDMHFSFHNMSEVKYPYFADIIRLPNMWLSIGDLNIYAGMALVLSITLLQLIKTYKLIKNKRKKR